MLGQTFETGKGRLQISALDVKAVMVCLMNTGHCPAVIGQKQHEIQYRPNMCC